MKRHILFMKNVDLANILLATEKCTNNGNWVFTCEDSIMDMKEIQKACTNFLKNTPYKDYKLCFANPNNYSDFITV